MKSYKEKINNGRQFKMNNENWYKSDCENCGYFIINSPFGFVESKECLLSPLEKCPFEFEHKDNNCSDNRKQRNNA